MNLFEYVKVLKVEDPPDRAESQASHETHFMMKDEIDGGALKGTDG
jgi:hypothetical protein